MTISKDRTIPPEPPPTDPISRIVRGSHAAVTCSGANLPLRAERCSTSTYRHARLEVEAPGVCGVERTQTVADKTVELLEATSPYAKTIIFCEDIEHAERTRRAIVNASPERVAESEKYVMRITGDNKEGKAQLDNFIHPEKRYPVVACTSRLMRTGVDAKTCEYIVLDRRIQSMTEFKQIIGRGTRIHERKYALLPHQDA